MAEQVVDSLVWKGSFDSSGVEEGLQKMEGLFRGSLENLLNNFISPITSALSVNKLFGEYTQQADKISKFSKSLGINGQDLQAWGEAATRAGGSAQAFQGTVRGLQRRISQAGSGAGAGAAAFKKFGIDLKDSEGNMKDSFQVLSELAEKAETMSNADFAGMAMQLRIDQGTIQLLQQGSKGVAELVERQRELGVYTEEDYKAAEDYNDAMADFKQATQMAASKVFSGLLPPLNAFLFAISKIIAFFTKNRALLRGATFATMAMIIATKVVPAIQKLKNGMALKNFGTWAKLAALFTAIYLVVEDFIVWLEGGESALEGFWSKFGTAEEVKEKLKNLKDMAMNFLKNLSKYLPLLKKLSVAVIALGAAFTIFQAIQKLIGMFKMLQGAVMAFNAAGWANPYVLIIGAIIAAIALLIIYWDDVTAAAKKCWDWMKNTWGGFSDWFLGIWDNIKTALMGWWDSIIDFFADGWNSFVNSLMKYIPNWLKKWLMKDDKNEPSAGSTTGESPLYQTLGKDMYPNPTGAAVEGLPARGGNITSNDVEVNFNVEANDPDELAAAVKQKQKSGGWFSRLFGGGDSTNAAYQVQQGQYN